MRFRILVAVPKIAQSKINEAELEIQSVQILETTENTYVMKIDSSITTDGKIHASVDPFEAEMYLEDWPAHVPFATVDMPETNSNKHQVVNVTQDVKIADMEEFTRFNVWFHNNETLRVTVNGKTKVKPSGLPRKYDVTFKKTVELKGLNHFAGTEVTDGHIGFGDGKDEPNFNGTTVIPNASVFTLDNVSRQSFSPCPTLTIVSGKRYLHEFCWRRGSRHSYDSKLGSQARRQRCQHHRQHEPNHGSQRRSEGTLL